MFSLLEKIGIPVPNKFEIALIVLLIFSISGNYLQWKTIQSKNEIIKGKDVEISMQSSTIDYLRKNMSETAEKINKLNDTLAKTEAEYQAELNKLISNLGQCKSNEPSSELEAKAQQSFQEIIDNLANSTIKKRAKQ